MSRTAGARKGGTTTGLYLRVTPVRSVGKLQAHIRYIAFRSRELPTDGRGVFGARTDHAEVATFSQRLPHFVTRHEMATKGYKVILSLSGAEFRRLGLTSWKPVVRDAMANLENRWGCKLDWIGAEHMIRRHPHCHLVIRAVRQDEHGKYRQLRLSKDHLADIRGEVGRILTREQSRTQELERAPAREHGLERGDAGRDLGGALIRSFVASLRTAEREIERDAAQQRTVDQRRRQKQRDWRAEERGR